MQSKPSPTNYRLPQLRNDSLVQCSLRKPKRATGNWVLVQTIHATITNDWHSPWLLCPPKIRHQPVEDQPDEPKQSKPIVASHSSRRRSPSCFANRLAARYRCGRCQAELGLWRCPCWLHHVQLPRWCGYSRVHLGLPKKGWDQRSRIDGWSHRLLRRYHFSQGS